MLVSVTPPCRGPADFGVKVTSTVHVSPALYVWLVPLVVQVPVPTSVKSRLAAPCVSTAGAAIVSVAAKTKVSEVVAGVVVATATEPRFTAGVVNPETLNVAFCIETL